MPYCKKCGEQLPEYARFCTKCGIADPFVPVQHDGVNNGNSLPNDPPPQMPPTPNPIPNPAPQQNAPAPNPAPQQPKTPKLNAAWFKEHFWVLYIVLGVVAFVMMQFSALAIFSAYGFGVFLCVMTMLLSLMFCAVGAIKYFTTDSTPTLGKKHSTSDTVCFAIGVIAFVYMLVMSIFIIKLGGDVQDLLDAIVSSVNI